MFKNCRAATLAIVASFCFTTSQYYTLAFTPLPCGSKLDFYLMNALLKDNLTCISLFILASTADVSQCLFAGSACSFHDDFSNGLRAVDFNMYNGDPVSASYVVESGTPSIGNDGILSLPLIKTPQAPFGATIMSTTRFLSYGFFEARLSTVAQSSVVTTFIGISNAQDEIDFEFLPKGQPGQDNQAQTNWFYHGQPIFDVNAQNLNAANNTYDNFHTYRITVQPDVITWSIDGVVSRTFTKASMADKSKWPGDTPLRISFGVWQDVTAPSWAGPNNVDFSKNVDLKIKYITIAGQACMGQAPPPSPPSSTSTSATTTSISSTSSTTGSSTSQTTTSVPQTSPTSPIISSSTGSSSASSGGVQASTGGNMPTSSSGYPSATPTPTIYPTVSSATGIYQSSSSSVLDSSSTLFPTSTPVVIYGKGPYATLPASSSSSVLDTSSTLMTPTPIPTSSSPYSVYGSSSPYGTAVTLNVSTNANTTLPNNNNTSSTSSSSSSSSSPSSSAATSSFNNLKSSARTRSEVVPRFIYVILFTSFLFFSLY